MRLVLTAAVSGLVLLAQPALSQTYPTKPIHILVPYPPGSIHQSVHEWLALDAGTQFQHIPYKGGAPAAAALAGGDIPFAVLASSSVAPQVKAGRLRVLAVTGAQPSKFSPEWPTLQSQGVKDVDASNWTLLLAPRGTPREIIDKLQAEGVKILAMPDVKERFPGGGGENLPSDAPEL